jgi:Zn-dependent protease with chaperone function
MATPPEPAHPGGALSPDAPEYPSAAVPPPPPYPGAAVPTPRRGDTGKAMPPPPPPYPTGAEPGTERTTSARPPVGPHPGQGDGLGPGTSPRSEAGPTAGPTAGERQLDETDFGRPGRVYLSHRQRGADATAVGQLLLFLPAFVVSLLIVVTISYALLSDVGWVIVVLWLASGALAFHRPTEGVLARHLLNLRYPTPRERARLEPVWREVTARAGIEGRTYELWIEESDDLNALAAAGHIVGVTRFSLENLPSGHLGAVLAHELAHHVGGHAWSSLLGEWYATPGRLAWAAVRRLPRLGITLGRRLNGCLALVLLLAVGSIVLAFALSCWFVILVLVVAPYPLAAVARRSELRADQHAAALGFGPMLAEVLQTMHTQQRETDDAAAASFAARGETDAFGRVIRTHGGRPGPLGRLLASHPDYHTRLHHLAPYLGSAR